MAQVKSDRCAVISCIHNLAYNDDKPELRRCKYGHEPEFTKAGPCPKEYETGMAMIGEEPTDVQ